MLIAQQMFILVYNTVTTYLLELASTPCKDVKAIDTPSPSIWGITNDCTGIQLDLGYIG